MPSKSQAQHNAMAAACHGKSTRGIPKKVGCEFIKADKAKAKAHTVKHRGKKFRFRE